MKTLILLIALASAAGDFETAVLTLTGASCVEELDESTMERFRELSLRPVELNSASRSRLLATGLFTPFQVASLLEYRQQTGAILSFVELSLVDGFNRDYVLALRHFVKLESAEPPGRRSGHRFHADMMLRGAVKEQEGHAAACGGKLKLGWGERVELDWASRTTYSDGSFGLGTLSAAYHGSRVPWKLVLGHFNARFGQGLTQWNGFSLQPYGSVGSLRRSGTGFSPTCSFSPELCGAAADVDLGRWNFGAAYSFEGSLPIAAVNYTGRSFAAGLTVTGKAAGTHFQVGVPNASVYGEVAWDGSLQALAGVKWTPSYGSTLGALLRYTGGVPECIAAAGLKGLDAVLAASPKQQRAMVKYAPELVLGQVRMVPALRIAARRTDVLRLEGRGELALEWGGWSFRSRCDLVRCSELGWLVNAEAGRTAGPLKAYLRFTAFRVDKWPDRIYVYERDAPGSFNVPAYYGRGWALALSGSWRPLRAHTFYWRVSYVTYPWMTDTKPSRFEAKLQYALSLW